MSTLNQIIARIPDGAAVPAEFQLFPFGRIEIVGSAPLIVDEEGMQAAVDAFKARGLDMVIDYEHQTLGRTGDADFSSPDGQAPAAGWIKALEPRGRDGLWAKVEWTQRASEYLSRREYRYFSPVFYMSKSTGKLLAIENVALTNSPRLNAIRPIVAKNSNPSEGEMEFLKLVAKQVGLPETATQQEVLVKLAAIQNAGPEYLKLSAKECGLTETATAEQVIATIKSIPAHIAEAKEVRTALGLAEASGKSEVIASIHALRQRPDGTVLQEIASLKDKLALRDRDEAVDSALKAGKITPAQKEWAEQYAHSDPEGFRLFVAKAPVLVPVGKVNIAGDPAAQDGPDDVQARINKLVGISDEVWRKHNPARQA